MATVVGQAVSVTVPADVKWTAIRVDALALALLEQPDLVQVKVVTWTAVHRYTAEGVAQTTTDPVPDDLMSWLSHHPGVLVTAPSTTTTLAGQPAHTIRITMDYRYNPADPAAGPAVGCSSSAECIALADTSDGVVALYSTSDMTIAAQDRSDNHRLVAVTLNHTNPGAPALVRSSTRWLRSAASSSTTGASSGPTNGSNAAARGWNRWPPTRSRSPSRRERHERRNPCPTR